MRCFAYVMALFIFACIPLSAQNFVVVTASHPQYPEIAVRAYGFAVDGTSQFLTSATVDDDGTNVSPTLTPEPTSSGNLLSCLVMVDVSSSMALGGATNNMTIAKAAVTAAPAMLNSVSDEIALGMFDARPTLLYGLSGDKDGYGQAIVNLRLGSGCLLDSALLAQPDGALTHLRNARYNRMLLLVVDGSPSFDMKKVLQNALSFRIPVYIIGVRTALTAELKKLADTTGGLYVERVSSEADADAYTRAYVSHAKQLPATLITYTKNANCVSTHVVSITSGTITRTISYTVPSVLLTYLEWSESGIDFGTGSEQSNRMVRLTARNGAITIQDISIDDSKFTVLQGISPGTVLQPDQSADVTIGYTGGALGAYGNVVITASGACNVPMLPLRAGGYTTGESLKLVAPNGGEKLLTGRPTTIEWTNVLPQDIVRIDYSINDGSTWTPLTETASGLNYSWTPGPEVSATAKVRVQRTSLPPEAIVKLVGHRDPVYSAVFSYDGQFVVTSGHDGTVRMWNSTTGEQIRELGNHGSMFAWAAATHPTEQIAASGGHDGTVKVYNLTTGERINTISAPSRVWSLDFSPNGENLVFGCDRSFTIINWRTGELVNTIVVTAGPVYSVRYSANGSSLITAESDRAVLRSTSTYAVLQEFAQGTGTVFAADVTPDNKMVVTGGSDFTIRSWDAESGNQLLSTAPYTASILSLDFSPSGSRFVAGGSDGAAKIFTTATLDLQNSLAATTSIIYSARYDWSGNRIATAGTDAIARVWDLVGATLAQDESDASFSIVGGKLTLSNVDHGMVSIGDGVERRENIIQNTGTDSLVVAGWRLVSGDLQEFDVLTPSSPTVIAPGGSMMIETVSQPIQAGKRSAILQVSAGGGWGSSELTSTGQLQSLQFPDAINFGRHVAGQSVVDTTILLWAASGGSPISVTRTVLMGVQAGSYSIIDGGGNFTVGAGQSHQFQVRFSPVMFGKFAAWVEFTLADGSVRVLRLYGEGTGDARIRTSTPTLLFTTDKCKNAPVVESFTVGNAGNSQLVIYTADLGGADASEFTVLEPTSYPVLINNNNNVTFRVQFTPTIVGVKDASLLISSNAIDATNGATVIPMIARKDSVGFDLSRNNVLFEGVNEGDAAEQRITIFNTGTYALQWPAKAIILDSFRIEVPQPPVTPPGGSSEVLIKFKGGVGGQVYTANYTFVDTLCGRSQALALEATVRSYIGCTVKIDTVTAKIGSSIGVPVHILNKVNFDRTNVTEVHAILRVNGSILTPVGVQSTFLPNGDRTFEVTLPIPTSGDVSTNLMFNTTWGNDTASTIRVDSTWTTDTILVKTQNGQVQLGDLCREGGVRLLLRERDRNGGQVVLHRPAEVQVVPNPLTTSATVDLHIVEDGPTRVEIVDAAGRVLMTVVDQPLRIGNYIMPLDATKLETGMYTMQLITRTQRMSHRFAIVR